MDTLNYASQSPSEHQSQPTELDMRRLSRHPAWKHIFVALNAETVRHLLSQPDSSEDLEQ